MAALTRCILCGALLVNGREWDGEYHVCEADRTPEVPRGTCSRYASCEAGYCYCPPDDSDVDYDDRQREARGEYLGELDEAREDEEP